MEHKKKINQEIEVVFDITCDCCGGSCGVLGEIHTHEYMTMAAEWGYNSNKDMENWKAHICEKCVDEKFNFIKFVKTKYFN